CRTNPRRVCAACRSIPFRLVDALMRRRFLLLNHSILFVVFLLLTSIALAQPPAQWAARGPGGGGALFAPVFSRHTPNEICLVCDMSEQFRSTNLGASWAATDFRQIQ